MSYYQLMDINFSHTNPTFVEHEGYTYLTFNGEFFKGCKRCGGAGQYSFNGEHSRCFDCDNTSAKLGEQLANKAAAEKWCHGKAVRKAQRERAAEAKRMVLVHAMEAQQAALQASDPDVYEFLMAVVIEDSEYTDEGEYVGPAANAEKDMFILDMARYLRYVGVLREFSPNMIAAIRHTMERRTTQAAEAASHPAPTGRVAVTGVIMSAKMVEGDYGTAYKILVKDDAGFKVWCSLPKAQASEAIEAFSEEIGTDHSGVGYSVWFTGSSNEPEKFTGVKGRRITFMATLEPSQDDVAFAFGSRPTKGSWL